MLIERRRKLIVIFQSYFYGATKARCVDEDVTMARMA